MIRWLSKRVDPDELMTLILVMVCGWRGMAAWCDLVGKPRDAPHLHIPPHWRAVLWFGCAIVGLVALRTPRRCAFRKWALSPMGVGGMFSFVLGSYLASWITAWDVLDALIPDDVIEGDPSAWGSIPYYALGVCWSIAIMLSPWDWSHMYRRSLRPGRLERIKGDAHG